MNTWRKNGSVMPVTLSGTVTSGSPITVGELVGVCAVDGVSGEEIEVALHGVHELPKVSAQAWTQGAVLYHDVSEGNITTSADGGANKQIGWAFADAANPSSTGLVLLGR